MAKRAAAEVTSVAVPEDEQSLVGGVKRLGAKALEIANAWALRASALTIADVNALGNMARAWGANLKMIDAECELDTRPLATDLARRRARWKESRTPWAMGVQIIKDTIDAWRVAQQERAMAALPSAPPDEQQRIVDAVVAKPMRTVKYYSARMVDETRVARRWWVIDQAGVDALARERKETFDEPGFELVVEERSTLG